MTQFGKFTFATAVLLTMSTVVTLLSEIAPYNLSEQIFISNVYFLNVYFCGFVLFRHRVVGLSVFCLFAVTSLLAPAYAFVPGLVNFGMVPLLASVFIVYISLFSLVHFIMWLNFNQVYWIDGKVYRYRGEDLEPVSLAA